MSPRTDADPARVLLPGDRVIVLGDEGGYLHEACPAGHLHHLTLADVEGDDTIEPWRRAVHRRLEQETATDGAPPAATTDGPGPSHLRAGS